MELKHKSVAANKNITFDCPVAGRWCEVETGGWRTEDGRRRRTEGCSRAAAVKPACHVLEDGSRVADDGSRTADEKPPVTCCRVQLGRQTTVTAGSKSGPSYRPDAAIDCSRLTKCKHARVTERNRGGPNNMSMS